jgi:hypothetical protein
MIVDRLLPGMDGLTIVEHRRSGARAARRRRRLSHQTLCDP